MEGRQGLTTSPTAMYKHSPPFVGVSKTEYWICGVATAVCYIIIFIRTHVIGFVILFVDNLDWHC